MPRKQGRKPVRAGEQKRQSRKRTTRRVTKKKLMRSGVPIRRVKTIEVQLPFLLIVAGIALMGLWALHVYIYHRSLSLSRSQVSRIVATTPKALPLPTHIFIPWNTDADIEPLSFTNGQWAISDTNVTYLLGSARPGEQGNIIMYGHNKRDILGNIRALKGGEKITVRTQDGKDHAYVVRATREVEPTDTSLLAPTKSEMLTLYTCSGFWDSKRFIVQAVPMQ